MSSHTSPPLKVDPASDPVDPELAPLLSEAFANVLITGARGAHAREAGMRSRLLDRVSASRAKSRETFTVRRRRLVSEELASGVRGGTLYGAPSGRALRPGEPVRTRLIEFEAGSEWAGPAADHHREFLVLQGAVRWGDVALGLRDYHVAPSGSAAPRVRACENAVLFLRESRVPAGCLDSPITVRDRQDDWPDYAPGIKRRVLWSHEGQAAMLYYAQPGACVPLHAHGHDEECLMVQGELFLDDVLLQQGDYQLAPAGTNHQITATDTGMIVYAHGDLDLKFMP